MSVSKRLQQHGVEGVLVSACIPNLTCAPSSFTSLLHILCILLRQSCKAVSSFCVGFKPHSLQMVAQFMFMWCYLQEMKLHQANSPIISLLTPGCMATLSPPSRMTVSNGSLLTLMPASDELRSLLVHKEEQHPSKERGHPLTPFVFRCLHQKRLWQVQMLFLDPPP